jgi:4-amino-4-deoxy-L-arabinose transferase-like glycosyltransferase
MKRWARNQRRRAEDSWHQVGLSLWVVVIALLVVSAVLRVVFLAGDHTPPFSDMVGYRDRAVLLLHEHTLQTSAVYGPTNHAPQYGATYHTPGYVVFLAGIFGLAGEHRLWVVYLVQSLLSLATLLGIYLLGVRLFSPKVGMVALLLATAYAPFVAYANALMPETMFICLLVFCVYAFVRGVQDGSPRVLLAAGVLCGFAALTRSVALLLPVVFLAWLMVAPGRALASRRVRRGALLFIGAMVLVLSPWVMRNYFEQHAFIPGDTVGGLNLFIGNHSGATGGFDERPIQKNPAAQQALAEGKRDAAYDSVLRDQALLWIRSHPRSFVKLVARRTYLYTTVGRDWLVTDLGSNVLVAVAPAQDWYTRILLALGLLGGIIGLRDRRRTFLPLALVAYFGATVAVFYFQARYRLPAMPFVVLLAAYALCILGRAALSGYRHTARPDDLGPPGDPSPPTMER